MHPGWDFDASSAQTWKVSALENHKNWSVKVHYFVTIIQYKVNTQLLI